MSDGYFRFQVVVNDSDLDKLNRELKLSEQIAKQTGQKISAELAKGLNGATSGLSSSRGRFSKSGQDLGLSFGSSFNDAAKRTILGAKGTYQNALSSIFQGIGQSVGSGLIDSAFSLMMMPVRATSAFVGDSIAMSRKVETLSTALKFVSGSAIEAAANMKFLREASDSLGYSLTTLIPGFNQLAASTKGTQLEGQATRDLFYSLATAGRVLGLSNEQLGNALVALSQMASKGTISMEELRGQLSEALPGAIQVFARGMGVSVAEFTKMVSAGEVGSDALVKFSAQIQKEMGSAVPAAMKTAAAASSTLQNTIAKLQDELGKSLEPAITESARFLTQTLSELENSGGFDALTAEAEKFAGFLRENPQYAIALGQALNELLESGLKALSEEAAKLLDYLEENPEAIKSAIAEVAELSGLLVDVIRFCGEVVRTLKSWDEWLGKSNDQFAQGEKNLAGFLERSQGILSAWTAIVGVIGKMPALVQQGVEGMAQATGAQSTDSGMGSAIGGVAQSVAASSGSGTAKASPEFLNRTRAIAKRLGMNPEHLLTAMLYESAGTLSPSIQGPNVPGQGRATGLIQFMPATARGLGTSSDALKRMSPEQQLAYVEKYFEPFKGQLNNFNRVYATIHGGNPNANMNASDGYRTTGQAAKEAQNIYGSQARAMLGQANSSSAQQSSTTQQRSRSQSTQQRLYPTIATGTIPAQEYGVDRGGRRHAGQDFDLGDNDSFRSYIGGRVTKVGNDPGGYFKYIDIFNEALQRVERIAELDRFNVKEGDMIQPGQVVGQGTNATGVVHYEIRSDMNAQGQGGYGFKGTEDPVKFLEGLGIVKRQGQRLEPTGASLNKGNETFVKAQEDAIAEARKKLQDRDRARSERLQQERKQRDQQISLQESKQDNDFAVQIASVENPQLKAQLENQRSQLQAQRQVDSQIRAAQDELADLKSARSLKVSDMKLGGSGDGVDYTAAIKQQEQYIAGLKQQRDEASKAPQAEWLQTVKKSTEDLTKATNEQNDALLSLNLQYEQPDTPDFNRLRAIASINSAYDSQKEAIEETIKSIKELAAVAPSADLNILLQNNEASLRRLEEGRGRAIALSNANFEEEQKEAAKQKQIDEISRQSDRRNTAASGQTSLLQGKISLGNLLGTDTSDLQKELALLQEQLRFESAIDELKKLELAGNTSAETLQQLYENASQLNSVNLEQINQQFNETRDILQNQLQSPLQTFLSDLLSGTKTIGEAFQSLISSLLSSLAQLAVNKLFTSLFSGLFGGSGGGGLLGIDLGTPVLNFASGGDVPAIAGNSFRDGYGEISKALKREGSNAVLAALTPGELVLDVKRSRKFRELGMDKVLNFSQGGTVPGSAMPVLSAAGVGGNAAIANIALNVASPQQGIDYDVVAKAAQKAAQLEILRQQRPKGSLDR